MPRQAKKDAPKRPRGRKAKPEAKEPDPTEPDRGPDPTEPIKVWLMPREAIGPLQAEPELTLAGRGKHTTFTLAESANGAFFIIGFIVLCLIIGSAYVNAWVLLLSAFVCWLTFVGWRYEYHSTARGQIRSLACVRGPVWLSYRSEKRH